MQVLLKMVKIDITISIGGKDSKISYADGEKLFQELSQLYTVKTQNDPSIYGQAFAGFEEDDSPSARSSCSGGCSDSEMNMNDFSGEGKLTVGNCTSSPAVTVSGADYVQKNEHLDQSIPNDEPVLTEDIAQMQAAIDKRIAEMKQAVDKENNK